MPLTREQKTTLIDLLTRVPASSTFDGRTALLGGTTLSLRRDEGSARGDLTMIVQQLLDLGAEVELAQMLESAIGYVEGTGVGRELAALRKSIAAKAPHREDEVREKGGGKAPPRPLRVFISHADADEDLLKDLIEQLATQEKRGTIRVWHRRKIAPGANTAQVLGDEMNTANVIVLLVTASYTASRFEEAERAVERHASGQATVIPVRARACVWSGAPFERLEALPRGKKPVASWNPRDEAWAEVVEGILSVLDGPAQGAV